MSSREKKAATESRRRTINYIVVAALAALIVTVLFLVFGRSDKGSSDNKAATGTSTEQVSNTGGASQPGSISRPTNSTTVSTGRVDHPRTEKMDIVHGTTGSGTAVKKNNASNTKSSDSNNPQYKPGSARVDYPGQSAQSGSSSKSSQPSRNR